jgi:quinol---cytochrome c reductase iron-sulfur subunit, bacillus type
VTSAHPQHDDAHDRRRFLGRATVAIGSVTAAAIAVPAVANVVAPALQTGTFEYVDLGPTSSFPHDPQVPWYVVTFESRHPDPTGLGRRVAFVRNDGDGTFTAMANTCMHVGCPVRAFVTGFGCPCHGGQYDLEGRPVAGPPVRPLNRYETHVDARSHLILGRLDAVDFELRRRPLAGPGVPVSGLLAPLYPAAPAT